MADNAPESLPESSPASGPAPPIASEPEPEAAPNPPPGTVVVPAPDTDDSSDEASSADDEAENDTEGAFTDIMRDRQARGKDPFYVEDEEEALERLRKQTRVLKIEARLRLQRPAPNIPMFTYYNYGKIESDDPSVPPVPKRNEIEEVMGKTEDYEDVSPRRRAAVILDTPELLMMYAQSMGETIPAVRYLFTLILCGYDAISAPRERVRLEDDDVDECEDEEIAAAAIREEYEKRDRDIQEADRLYQETAQAAAQARAQSALKRKASD